MMKKSSESRDILDEISKEESLRTDRGFKKDLARIDTPKFDEKNGLGEVEEANFDVMDLENEFELSDMQKCKRQLCQTLFLNK
jgi:hypothetical protein